MNFSFPERANMTAIEILVIFHKSIKSIDVTDRLVTNGFQLPTMGYITNPCRYMPHGYIKPNTVLRMMQAGMKKRPKPQYKNWNIGNHINPNEWNKTSIRVGGMRPPRITHP